MTQFKQAYNLILDADQILELSDDLHASSITASLSGKHELFRLFTKCGHLIRDYRTINVRHREILDDRNKALAMLDALDIWNGADDLVHYRLRDFLVEVSENTTDPVLLGRIQKALETLKTA